MTMSRDMNAIPSERRYRAPSRSLERAVALGMLLTLSGCGASRIDSAMPASTPTYSISGTISGLTSTGLVLAIGGQNVVVPPGKTGSFTQQLAASLPSGTQYSVAVKAQPSGQTCAVAGGTGKIGSANVANVVVTCADQAFALGGTLSGLNVPGLVLANGSDTLTVMSGATSFTMPRNVPTPVVMR
jgi:hypothetical protein